MAHAGLPVIEAENIPAGKMALIRHGAVVWIATIGDPVEDVDCTAIAVNPVDAARVRAAVRAAYGP